MAEGFDAYYTWLGIPRNEQPPHFYRLLGLQPFEGNPEVIEHAADRQMAHLRSLQISQRAHWTQRLLNELAAARICLLSPTRKAEYDAQLREAIAAWPGQGASESRESESTWDIEPSQGKGERVFGNYALLERLAVTRTGKLYKARHRTMNRLAALKILSADAMRSPEDVARFRRKIQILARLAHPNLVAAYEAGLRHGRQFLVMEYVDGRDLAALLKERGRLEVDRALHYVRQAAAALGHLHRQGIVHRNVKPGNLLIDRGDVLRLVGLGLAHIVPNSPFSDGQNLAQMGRRMGTRAFMSPEQAIDSSQVDRRSDIYSLGCTLYAMLTAAAPYAGKSLTAQMIAHRDDPVPSLREARPEVSPGLDDALRRMLAKRPDDRPASMEEVIAAIAT